jgi:uncharacterized membrane protein YecN with MAPEG domain
MAILLPTTLATAAAAALINFWLANRVGRVRMREKISVGDGGNEGLSRRMRAQLNFAENTPFVLVLIAAIELAGRGGVWLSLVGGAYMLARVLHGLGMDGGPWQWGRTVGIVVTMLTHVVLSVAAVLVLLGVV